MTKRWAYQDWDEYVFRLADYIEFHQNNPKSAENLLKNYLRFRTPGAAHKMASFARPGTRDYMTKPRLVTYDNMRL